MRASRPWRLSRVSVTPRGSPGRFAEHQPLNRQSERYAPRGHPRELIVVPVLLRRHFAGHTRAASSSRWPTSLHMWKERRSVLANCRGSDEASAQRRISCSTNSWPSGWFVRQLTDRNRSNAGLGEDLSLPAKRTDLIVPIRGYHRHCHSGSSRNSPVAGRAQVCHWPAPRLARPANQGTFAVAQERLDRCIVHG